MGEDFRSLHKPPANVLDFIASGWPLAMNPGNSPAEYLAGMGFELVAPDDPERWLSEDDRQKTVRWPLCGSCSPASVWASAGGG